MIPAIDEPITVAAADPEWPMWFREEADSLVASVPGLVGIEHFGSTAVAGLAAKPIIDILAGVSRNPPDQVQSAALRALGYEGLGEAGVPGRYYFRKRGMHNYNVAVVVHRAALWNDNLLLRDFLRASSSERERYEKSKLRAVADGHTSLLAYSAAKGPVVSELLERARRWRTS